MSVPLQLDSSPPPALCVLPPWSLGSSRSQLLFVSWVTCPKRASLVESPSPIVGQCSHIRPPYRLQVWWSSAIEEDVATYSGGIAKSHSSQQGPVGASEKWMLANLPHTKCCASSCGAYKDGEDSVPVHVEYMQICNCATRDTSTVHRRIRFLYTRITCVIRAVLSRSELHINLI